jgi:hypothetical protein
MIPGKSHTDLSLWQLYLIFGLMLPIGKAANIIPLVAALRAAGDYRLPNPADGFC